MKTKPKTAMPSRLAVERLWVRPPSVANCELPRKTSVAAFCNTTKPPRALELRCKPYKHERASAGAGSWLMHTSLCWTFHCYAGKNTWQPQNSSWSASYAAFQRFHIRFLYHWLWKIVIMMTDDTQVRHWRYICKFCDSTEAYFSAQQNISVQWVEEGCDTAAAPPASLGVGASATSSLPPFRPVVGRASLSSSRSLAPTSQPAAIGPRGYRNSPSASGHLTAPSVYSHHV